MDRFGMNILLPLEERITTLVALVKRGYLDRLTLSHDCFCWTGFLPADGAQRKHVHDPSYLYVSQTVIPALLETGITQDQIDTMFIDNPRRHFEGAAARFAERNGRST
jgi:phosphotriesterase-related protein